MSNLYDEAYADAEQVVRLGTLQVPTGRIVACDPYFCASEPPATYSIAYQSRPCALPAS